MRKAQIQNDDNNYQNIELDITSKAGEIKASFSFHKIMPKKRSNDYLIY